VNKTGNTIVYQSTLETVQRSLYLFIKNIFSPLETLNPNAKNKNGECAIDIAVKNLDLPTIYLLLKMNVEFEINKKDEQGKTLLIKVMQIIINSIDIEIIHNPLILTSYIINNLECLKNEIALIKLIISKNGSPLIKDNSNNNAFDYSRNNCCMPSITALLASHHSLNQESLLKPKAIINYNKKTENIVKQAIKIAPQKTREAENAKNHLAGLMIHNLCMNVTVYKFKHMWEKIKHKYLGDINSDVGKFIGLIHISKRSRILERSC